MTIDTKPAVPGMGMIAFRDGKLVMSNIFFEDDGAAKRVITALEAEFEDNRTPQPETVAVEKAVWERVVAILVTVSDVSLSFTLLELAVEAGALHKLLSPVDPDRRQAINVLAECGWIDTDDNYDAACELALAAIARGRALAGGAA